MALEDIIRKINEDAGAEADSLLSLARAEGEAIREKAKRQTDTIRSELTATAKKRAEEHASRIKTLAGLDLRKELLREKKSLIEEAFKRAEEKVKNFAPEEYRVFLRPLILDAVESGQEEVIPSASHRHLFSAEFLKSLNDDLGPQRGHLRLSEESGDFAGGFILRERNKETNMTLESLTKSLRETLEPGIAAILFDKHGSA